MPKCRLWPHASPSGLRDPPARPLSRVALAHRREKPIPTCHEAGLDRPRHDSPGAPLSLLRWFDAAPARVLGGALVALTALRVWGLTQSPLELHFDEAQYWMWSRTLEWG